MLINTFFLRVSSSCNLNCDYCYVFKHRDKSWKRMPPIMNLDSIIMFTKRLNEYIISNDIKEINIIFHGREPLMCGADTLINYSDIIKQSVSNNVKLNFSLQTNGTLITESFLNKCYDRNIGISVSIDGSCNSHNKHRKYKNGEGSFNDVLNNIIRLKEFPTIFEGVIGVIDPFISAEETVGFFDNLEVEHVDLLLPDSTYLDPPPGRDTDKSLYSKWLIDAFDSWFFYHQSIHLRTFEHILNGIIGEDGTLDTFGLGQLDYLTIETDGSYHTTDILKVAFENASYIGYGINDKSISDAINSDKVKQYNSLLSYSKLPSKCTSCKYSHICGGGSLPHRYNPSNGFDNPSIYCDEYFLLIEHANHIILKAIEDAAND